MHKSISSRFCAVMLLLSASSCKTAKTVKSPPCPADVACTMMYAMVTVRVQKPDGSPFYPDSVRLVRKSDGVVLRAERSDMEGSTYILISDSHVERLKNTSEKYHFEGYAGGRRVFSEPYVLGADCCHVLKTEGTDIIRVNQ